MNEAFWLIIASEAQTDLVVARGMAVVELAELNAQLDAS